TRSAPWSRRWWSCPTSRSARGAPRSRSYSVASSEGRARLLGVAHRAAPAPAPLQVLDPVPGDAHARARPQVVQVAAALQVVDDAVRLLRAVAELGPHLARLHHARAVPSRALVDALEQSEAPLFPCPATLRVVPPQ